MHSPPIGIAKLSEVFMNYNLLICANLNHRHKTKMYERDWLLITWSFYPFCQVPLMGLNRLNKQTNKQTNKHMSKRCEYKWNGCIFFHFWVRCTSRYSTVCLARTNCCIYIVQVHPMICTLLEGNTYCHKSVLYLTAYTDQVTATRWSAWPIHLVCLTISLHVLYCPDYLLGS